MSWMKNLVTVAALGLLLAACGSSGSSTASGGSAREVVFEMRDNAFSPATVSAAKGEKVKLTFNNKGTVEHEALVGDDAAQDAHAADMGSSDAMDGMHHDDSGALITVAPGKSGSLTYTFDKTGSIVIGCHEPGHYEAGMKVAVTVT
ncbi:MAG: cupredoxin domain-containing protein [Acidimicrobiales bacterium]